MDIALIFLLAFLPVLLWGALFRLKDHAHPEPRKWLMMAFFSGALANLPVLGFSFVWKIFTGVEWISWIDSFSQHALALSLLSVFLLAMIEEFFKHRAVLGIGSEVQMRFDELSDGMLYSIAAALGFSFFENAVYLWLIYAPMHAFSPEFWSAFFFRGGGTMLGHIVFSGVFGYFWGLAILVRLEKYAFFKSEEKSFRRFFDKFWLSSEPGKSPFKKLFETLSFHTIRAFFGKKEYLKGKLSPTSLVAEGFWLATVLHTLFNTVLSFHWEGRNALFLIAPILIFGISFLLQRFSSMNEIPLRSKLF